MVHPGTILLARTNTSSFLVPSASEQLIAHVFSPSSGNVQVRRRRDCSTDLVSSFNLAYSRHSPPEDHTEKGNKLLILSMVETIDPKNLVGPMEEARSARQQ